MISTISDDEWGESPKFKGAVLVMIIEIGISGDGTVPKYMYIAMQRLGYTWNGEMWEKTLPNKWEKAEKA